MAEAMSREVDATDFSKIDMRELFSQSVAWKEKNLI